MYLLTAVNTVKQSGENICTRKKVQRRTNCFSPSYVLQSMPYIFFSPGSYMGHSQPDFHFSLNRVFIFGCLLFLFVFLVEFSLVFVLLSWFHYTFNVPPHCFTAMSRRLRGCTNEQALCADSCRFIVTHCDRWTISDAD